MYKNILIATDGSELAAKGVRHGLELAKTTGAKATIVTATEMWDALEMASQARRQNFSAAPDYDKAVAASAKQILDDASNIANQLGVTVDVLHIRDKKPAEGILEAAKERNFDVIVIASHGHRGIRRMLLGSVAMEVVSLSTIPTLIVR